jgi:hypothetical protein
VDNFLEKMMGLYLMSTNGVVINERLEWKLEKIIEFINKLSTVLIVDNVHNFPHVYAFLLF